MLGQSQLVHGAYVRVNYTEDHFDSQPLANHAHAIASKLVGVGEIRVAPAVKFLLVNLGHEVVGQSSSLWGREPRRVGPDRLQRAVDPPSRLRVNGQMHVGSARFLSQFKVIVHVRQWVRLERDFWNAALCHHGDAGCSQPLPLTQHGSVTVHVPPRDLVPTSLRRFFTSSMITGRARLAAILSAPSAKPVSSSFFPAFFPLVAST